MMPKVNRGTLWNRANPERKKEADKRFWRKNRERLLRKAKEKRLDNPEQAIFYKAKNRAKKKGVPFDIDISDIVIPKVCPILGIVLEFNSEYRSEATPSLDRIIPELGYVKGNVHVISWRANRIKNDGSLHDFEMLVKYLTSI